MSKKSCIKCEVHLLPEAKFCHQCGQGTACQCPNCSTVVTAENVFCHACGHQLSENKQSSSRDLAKPADISAEGERKLVSILFADLCNFTTLSEKLDPEKVTDLLNACFDRLGKVIQRYEGHIDKFMGDCIMVVFGVPQAHENDAQLSIECAFAMLEELKAFNREYGFDLGIKIGINSGVVICAEIGTQEKRDFTVIGDVVNVAQRIQSIAERNEVLVGTELHKNCAKSFHFLKKSNVVLKGKKDRVDLYSARPKGAKEEIVRPQSTFVGRRFEGRKLDVILERLEKSQGQILLITGEPGIGKTRFIDSISECIREKHLKFFETRCERMRHETPYFAVHQLFTSLLQFHDQRGAIEQSRDPILVDLIQELSQFSREQTTEVLGAQKKKQAIFVSAKRYMYQFAQRFPCVFHFEDLQWIDPLSKELLEYILSDLKSYPLMISATARPEFEHSWEIFDNFTHLPLKPLSEKESSDFIKRVLLTRKLPSRLLDTVYQRSDGNPFYIEEILKGMIESAVLKKEEGAWIFSSQMAEEVPTSLRALIASRIDRLSPKEKNILQLCSVIGRKFNDQILQMLSGEGNKLYEVLLNLRRKDLVYESDLQGDLIEYEFKHALTQEVAYDGILRKHRKKYHAKLAQILEKSYLQRENPLEIESPDSLAQHYLEAEVYDKAAVYLFLTGKEQSRAFNNDSALKNLELCLSCLEKEANAELRNQAYFEITGVLARTGHLEEAEQKIHDLLRLLHDENNYSGLADAYRYKAFILRLKSELSEAKAEVEKSIQFARRGEDREASIRSSKALGIIMMQTGGFKEAKVHFETALQGALELGLDELISECLLDLSTIYIHEQNLDEAENRLQESLVVASKDERYRAVMVRILINLGAINYYREEYRTALDRFIEASDMAEQIGDLSTLMLAKHNIGEICMMYQRYEDALEQYQDSYELALDLQDKGQCYHNLVYIGHLLSTLGRPEEAEQRLVEASEKTSELGLPLIRCEALFRLGEFYRKQDDILQARESFATCLQLAEELNLRASIDRASKALSNLDAAEVAAS